MPELKKVESQEQVKNNTPPQGYFSLFIDFVDGKYALRAKKPDGSIVTILE